MVRVISKGMEGTSVLIHRFVVDGRISTNRNFNACLRHIFSLVDRIILAIVLTIGAHNAIITTFAYSRKRG